MNTMLRSPNAPQQTALAHSTLPPGTHTVSSGVPKGVWIGGGVMALSIVALATALVMKSGGNEAPAQLAATSPAVTATTATPAPTPAPVAATPAPVAEPAPAPAPVHHVVRHTTPAHSTTTTTTSTTETTGSTSAGGTGVSSTGTGPATTETTRVASVPVCTTCGTIDSFDAVQVAGTTNGIGAAAGGVGGAVIGSQIAGRHNKTLGGVIGAIGGGLLGNAIEQHQRTTTMYDVHVRMNDGTMRTVRQSTIPQVGSRVSVEGNTLHAAPQQTSSSTGNAGNGNANFGPSGNGGAAFTPSGS